MKIIQTEQTPLGDYFHDAKLITVFEELKNMIDEFELDSEDLDFCVDYLVSHLKELKKIAKNIEKKSSIADRIDGLNLVD